MTSSTSFHLALVCVCICYASVLLGGAEACSCMPEHPQQMICQNESFVAIVKVMSSSYVRTADKLYRNRRELAVIDRQRDVITTADTRHVAGGSSKHDSKGTYRDVITTHKAWAPKDVHVKNVRSTDLLRYRVKIYKSFKGLTVHRSADNTREKHYVYTAADEGMCGRKLNIKQTYLLIGAVVEGRARVSLCNPAIAWTALPKHERQAIRRNMADAGEACACRVVSCPWSRCEPQSPAECAWTNRMEKLAGNRSPLNFLCAPGNDVGAGGQQCRWKGRLMTKASKLVRRRRRHNENARRRQRLLTNTQTGGPPEMP